MTDAHRLIYMTVGSRAEALSIADDLIEQRLAACANVIDGVMSVYRWEGRVHHDDEVVVIVKTTEACVAPLIQRAKELHSYECPCIVALTIGDGHLPFLKWIDEQIIELNQ